MYRQGKDLPSFEVEGVTFKVLTPKGGVLGSGDTYTLSNVIFEGKQPAAILVVGDGDGDLDLWVYDENTGGLIDKDTGYSSVGGVYWVPRYEGPFVVRVKNVGGRAEQYVILANW